MIWLSAGPSYNHGYRRLPVKWNKNWRTNQRVGCELDLSFDRVASAGFCERPSMSARIGQTVVAIIRCVFKGMVLWC